jgi:hypothetical protein
VQLHAPHADAQRETGNRLAVGAGEARDGALADAFAERCDISICFSRERLFTEAHASLREGMD